jgi:AcrR family transcriptional regulator
MLAQIPIRIAQHTRRRARQEATTMDQVTPRVRRPRADFARNRHEILSSAERHFTAEGVNTSLETVAREAGVGSATLYRHFPTREALLAEVLEGRSDRLATDTERIAAIADPGKALAEWLLAMEDYFAAFEGLTGPLLDAFLAEHNPLTTTCSNFINVTEDFLGAAQHAGVARSDLRARDLFLATLMLSWVRGAALADGSSQPRMRLLIENGWAARA